MLHVRSVFKVFLGRAPNCDIFYKRIYVLPAEQIEEKTVLGGPEACSPGKILKFYIVQWPF